MAYGKCPICGQTFEGKSAGDVCYCSPCKQRVVLSSTGRLSPSMREDVSSRIPKGKCPACGRVVEGHQAGDYCWCETCKMKVLLAPVARKTKTEVGKHHDTLASSSSQAKAKSQAHPKPTTTQHQVQKPGWGATVGAFFLCWLASAFCSALASMLLGSGAGFTGYSTGGLLTLALSLMCALVYRSSGKTAGITIAVVIGGCVIGFIAASLGMLLVR